MGLNVSKFVTYMSKSRALPYLKGAAIGGAIGATIGIVELAVDAYQIKKSEQKYFNEPTPVEVSVTVGDAVEVDLDKLKSAYDGIDINM